MARLLIVGAGGFGREVYYWARDASEKTGEFEVAGFLDRSPEALAGFSIPVPVLGDPETYEPRKDEVFVVAVGDPVLKLKLAGLIAGRGGQFQSIIHPTALVGPDSVLGPGCILCPGSIVTTNVTLGAHVALNLNASVGHDASIGEGCTLNCHADVTGRVKLGVGVFLGSHASILPSVQVGDYARIGAGSVVIRAVPARTTMMGVPATKLFMVPSDGN